jgi:tyrosine-protein kinase Etk/Wzc
MVASLQSRADQMEKGDSKSRFGSLSTAQVPGLELEYISKARDVKYHEALFGIIARQYEAARLDEAQT